MASLGACNIAWRYWMTLGEGKPGVWVLILELIISASSVPARLGIRPEDRYDAEKLLQRWSARLH